MAFFDHIIHRMQVRIRWARIIVGRIIRFITHDIWFLNMKDLSRWNARMVQDAKVVLLMLRTFSDQKIGYQVTALAYRSVMSVIPFLAIAFYLTGGLGISDILVDFLQENIEDESLLSGILDAATNILTTAESGLFGLISMLSFFWIVISLMLTVRQVFNNVWRAKETTNVFQLAGILLVILILSPFVIILFFSGSVVYSHVLDLLVPSRLFFSESLKSFLSWALFAGAAILILSAMYKYIPGTKVRYKYALKAAIVAGIIFTGVQYLYLETQVLVAKSNAVYGFLAAIPLFMVWLNMGWSIVLYGAELSYSFQNVHKLELNGFLEKKN